MIGAYLLIVSLTGWPQKVSN